MVWVYTNCIVDRSFYMHGDKSISVGMGVDVAVWSCIVMCPSQLDCCIPGRKVRFLRCVWMLHLCPNNVHAIECYNDHVIYIQFRPITFIVAFHWQRHSIQFNAFQYKWSYAILCISLATPFNSLQLNSMHFTSNYYMQLNRNVAFQWNCIQITSIKFS